MAGLQKVPEPPDGEGDPRPLGEGETPTPSNPQAELYTLLYEELRAIAARLMSRQPPTHMLQATALLNEACLRLLARRPSQWNDHRHFLQAAALAMRHILIDHRRGEEAKRAKPPGDRIPLESIVVAMEESTGPLLALDGALERLSELNPRGAEIVQLCFFGGHTRDEAAAILGISPRQAFRWWASARVQLKDLLDRG